jgi:hypothetical protein
VPPKAGPKRRFRSAEGGSEAAGEATDLIAFAFALIFFLQIPPKNRMSSPKTTQIPQKTGVRLGILVMPN